MGSSSLQHLLSGANEPFAPHVAIFALEGSAGEGTEEDFSRRGTGGMTIEAASFWAHRADLALAFADSPHAI
jgi:hypothetical protein